MGRPFLRGIISFVVLCTFAILLPPAAASASTDTSFISFTSDPEDWVGQGESRTLAATDGRLEFTMIDASTFRAFYQGFDGIRAGLDLRVPSGQTVVTGVYENASRFPFGDPSLPQMDFYYDHRGCSTITGRFEVLEATYGPYNYIQSLDLTFEQHCEGSTAAVYGKVRVVNPPAPPLQSVHVSVDSIDTVTKDGIATIAGTVTCSLPLSWPDYTTVNGTVSQTTRDGVVTQEIPTIAPSCTPDSDPWSYTVFGLKVGKAVVSLTARAIEPNYPGHYAAATVTATVHLVPRMNDRPEAT
jgi:hypothetical protein